MKGIGGILVLVGPDGCGKSTIAGILSNKLQKAGIAVMHQHWRPMLLPSPRVFLGQRPCGDPSQPHKAKRHSLPVSLLLTFYYWTDFWYGYFARVLPFTRAGGITIIERYVFDMVMDPVRHRLNIPARVTSCLCRVTPAPKLIVYLSGDPRVMFERKGELDPLEIQNQMVRLEEHLRSYCQTISISTTENAPEVVVDRILQKLGISAMSS